MRIELEQIMRFPSYVDRPEKPAVGENARQPIFKNNGLYITKKLKSKQCKLQTLSNHQAPNTDNSLKIILKNITDDEIKPARLKK